MKIELSAKKVKSEPTNYICDECGVELDENNMNIQDDAVFCNVCWEEVKNEM